MLKGSTLAKFKGKEAMTQADSRLNPACSMLVKPQADMLCLQLLLISQVAYGHLHRAQRLQVAQSQSY